jgi:hypothetical protein
MAVFLLGWHGRFSETVQAVVYWGPKELRRRPVWSDMQDAYDTL